jgi:sarcosine oxidase subunit beta
VRAELPWLGDAVLGASLSPTDGQANPRVVGPAYARLAARLGVDIREMTSARSAITTGSGFGIEADGLIVTARHLVNAAGAGGGLIASAFGEPVPLTPLSPNMLVTESLPYFISRSIGVCGGDVYIRQTRRGNAIFGGGQGWHDADLGLARPSNAASLGGMRRTLQLVPSLTHAQVIRTWTGVDGQLPDHIPVIGLSGTTPNLIHAFGFSGHGFQLAPAVGLIIAELVTQGRTPTPIAPFSIERFANWQQKEATIQGHTEH